MVTTKEVATPCICGKLQEVKRVCDNGRKAASTTVKVIELERKSVAMKH